MASYGQFLEVAGLEKAKCKKVRYYLITLGEDLNNVHVADIFSQPNALAAASPSGIDLALGLELERSSGHRAFVEEPAHGEAIAGFLDHQCATLSWRCNAWTRHTRSSGTCWMLSHLIARMAVFSSQAAQEP